MFRGASSISLDSKGRFAIPAKYREGLSETCGGSLVCTVDADYPCLLLYPLPNWQVVEDKLIKLSSMNSMERRLQRLLLGHADECDMDKSGRLLIAPTLRKYASLSHKIMLVGQLNRFEIWDEDAWNAQIAADLDVDLTQTESLSERLQDFTL